MLVPIVCSVMMLLGLASAFQMWRDFAANVITFNLGLLFLPLGIWLGLALPAARMVTTLTFTLFYTALACLAAAYLISLHGMALPGQSLRTMPVPGGPVAVLGIMFGVLFILQRLTYQPSFKDHLERADA